MSYKAFESPINFSLATKTYGATKDKFNKNGFIIPIKLDAHTADIIVNLSVDLETKNPVYGKISSTLYLKTKDIQDELLSPTDIHIEFSAIGTYTSNTGHYLSFKITHLEKQEKVKEISKGFKL